MTTLVIDELITELTQDVNIKKDIKIGSIKFQFYVHNMPTGTFKLEILKDSVLYAEFPFTSNDLRNSFGATSNYFRVFYPFGYQENLTLYQGLYSFKISSIGYTYSATSFLGICKDWQTYFGQPLATSVEFTEYPFSYRILERKPREL